jgi:histidinol phosphatase-like enzyme (inositol monophosphatase family)
MARFRSQDLAVETKPDLTLVSDADRAAEELIRSQLSRTRPRDAVVGEEFEPTGHGPRRWIVDPIDGTHNFVRGVPVWATLIALVVAEEPVMGLVAAPALGRRWWAAKGSGAYAGRSLTSATRIRTSGVQRLADASISLSSVTSWDAEIGRTDAVLDLARDCWRQRAYGDFWSYMLLAEGSVDIACRTRTRALRHGGPGADRDRGRRPIHRSRWTARVLERQRRRHQWAAARDGAGPHRRLTAGVRTTRADPVRSPRPPGAGGSACETAHRHTRSVCRPPR